MNKFLNDIVMFLYSPNSKTFNLCVVFIWNNEQSIMSKSLNNKKKH